MSFEVIEQARANNIHLLCLPAHTTHILQPLDVGVFKSFKTNFSKACSRYIAKTGRVVTTDKIASLVAEAWPVSYTALNVMAGFKKCGIVPLNPSQVTDRQLMPSVGVKPKQKDVDPGAEKERPVSDASGPLFSPEKEVLYQKRFEEGYNVRDPDYITWVKINHPTSDLCSLYAESSTSSSKSPTVSSKGATNHPTSEPSGLQTESSTSSSKSPTVSAPGSKGATSDLSDILILPKPKSPETKRKPKKPLLNKKTVCITDDAVYDSMKLEAAEKEAEKEKERKANEKAEKKKAKNETKEAAKRKPKKNDSKEGGGKDQEDETCQTEIRRTQVKQQSKVTRLCARSVDLYMRTVTIYGYVVMVVIPGMIRSVHL